MSKIDSLDAELVELDTDLPAVDTRDVKDGDSHRNRIIENALCKKSFAFSHNS